MGTQTQNAPSTALSKLLSDAGLAPEKAGLIVETLAPLVEQAGELCREAQCVTVTDATQVSEMRQAREIRLRLVKVRTGAEAARKILKADALALGKAIDACGNWIKNQTEPVEARLLECELFAERAEAKRKQQLRDDRFALLAQVGPVDAAIVSTLGEMKQDAFDQMLEGAVLARKARDEAAAKVDAERRAREQAEAQERERLRVENEKLRAEREEQDRLARESAERERKAREAIEAKAKAEREAAEIKARAEREAIRAKAAAEQAEAERKLKAEREAREKLEREQRERDAAEKKRRDAEARAAKRAAAAPDADKLRAYAKALRSIPAPTFKTQDGCDAFAIIESEVERLHADIVRAADAIGGGE